MFKPLRKCILVSLFAGAAAFAQTPVTFAKKQIEIAGKTLTVEVAESEAQAERGLMYRTTPLTDEQGMLFIFKEENPLSFWMKNTFIPLSIGFFDKNKKLVYMTEMQPVRSEMETPKSYHCRRPAMYALELPSGWLKRNKVTLGTAFKYR